MQTSRQTEFEITPAVKKEIIKIVDGRIREAHVTKEDFSELKGIVRELAEAQKRTEISV
jgi:maleate cis-trans isomerase